MPTLCCSWNCQGESLGREEETRQVSVSRLEETLIVQGFVNGISHSPIHFYREKLRRRI